ncbi:MAG TPA: hypothetical protein VHL80_05430 [Polyangia bacterium]|nr:hypothetical protein [Polyangia bacterium]
MSSNGVGRALLALLAVAASACGGRSGPKYPAPKYPDLGACVDGVCDASADGRPGDAGGSAAACTPAGASDAGAPAPCLLVIASGRNDLVGLALDGAGVFWTERSGASYAVMRAPALGGPARAVVTSIGRAVALGGGRVFLDSGNGLVATAAAEVSATAPFQGFGRTIAASSADVYVATCDGTFGAVLDLPTSGAPPTTLGAVGCMNDLALDAAGLYGASIGGDRGGGIIVAAGIWAWPLGGAPGAPLIGGATSGAGDAAAGGGGGASPDSAAGDAADGGPPLAPYAPVGVVADAAHVYWTERGHGDAIPPDGAVMKMPLAGGAPEVLAAGLHGPGDLALDGDAVYWANTDGRIMKVSVAGGAPTVLATGQVDPLNVTVDATAVYWTNRGGVGAPEGAVLRLTPK